MAASHPPSRTLGVGPMGRSSLATTLAQSWQQSGVELPFPFEGRAAEDRRVPGRRVGPAAGRQQPQAAHGRRDHGALRGRPRRCGYAVLRWARRSPTTRSRSAGGCRCRSAAAAQPGHRAEGTAQALSAVVTASRPRSRQAFERGQGLPRRTASPAALAALRGERQAPPRLGTLGEGLDADAITIVPDEQETPLVPEDRPHRQRAGAGRPHARQHAVARAGAAVTTVRTTGSGARAPGPGQGRRDAARSIAASSSSSDDRRPISRRPTAAAPPGGPVRRPGPRRGHGQLVATGACRRPPSRHARRRGRATSAAPAATARRLQRGPRRRARRAAGHPGAVAGCRRRRRAQAAQRPPRRRRRRRPGPGPGRDAARPVRILAVGQRRPTCSSDTVADRRGELEVAAGHRAARRDRPGHR